MLCCYNLTHKNCAITRTLNGPYMSFRETLKNLPLLGLVSIIFFLCGAFLESRLKPTFQATAIIVFEPTYSDLSLKYVDGNQRIITAIAEAKLGLSTKIKFDSSTRILSFVAGSSDEAAQLRAQIVGSIIEEANSRLLEIVTIELDGAEDTLRGWVPAPDQQESIFVLQSNGLEELRKYGLAKQLKSKLESGGSNYKVVNG